LPGGNVGQLKNTVAVQSNLDELLGATRVVSEGDAPTFDLSAGLKDDTPAIAPAQPESLFTDGTTTTGIDFDLDGDDVGKDDLLASSGGTSTSIDFDLGGSGTEQAVAVSSPAPVPAAASRPQPEPAPTPSVAAKNVAESDLVSSLEFDLPEVGQIGTGSTAPTFDMSATVVMPMVGGDGGEDGATLDLERTSFDPSALDFDLDLGATGEPSSAAPQAPAAPASNAAPVELADSNETDTKLELARAYQDMGDTEGALDLLREIVAESSGEQKVAAQALIEELS
jgi:pilus assembly protein FimV